MAEGGRGVALEHAGMKELEAQVKTCQLCRLARTRTNAVPGEGNLHAEVMLIGEGPGYHEDKQGRPFVGAAGQFLNELLGVAGLDRESVYIANVVKCRPPNNRDPEPVEIAACAPYLERQIALINPKVIVTLGRYSMARFFPGERVSSIHGTARLIDGRLCVAMYHPAAGLHQASLADVIRADFRKLPIYISEANRRLFVPPVEEDTENLEQAEEARASVVNEPETRAVLTADETATTPADMAATEAADLVEEEVVPPAVTQVDVQAETAPEASVHVREKVKVDAAAVQVVEPDAGAQPLKKKREKVEKKPAKKQNDYEQLTFF